MHAGVVESAVVGYPHDIKGQGVYAYVVFNGTLNDANLIRQDINLTVSRIIGAIAKADKIQFVTGLPKTRSGKIMRRILRYMGLDYPTKESLAKFNERKKRGEVPSNASPGGGIGIHGTWPSDDYFIDKYKNWTNGCISLKNDDVEDLYSYVPIGTPITIRK